MNTKTGKHTEEPWKVDKSEIVGQFNGEPIQIALMSMTRWTGSTKRERELREKWEVETLANAQLIASAPELLLMLKRNTPYLPEGSLARLEAEALIAKAEGRA